MEKKEIGSYSVNAIIAMYKEQDALREKEIKEDCPCDCNNVIPVLGYENSIRGERCTVCGQLFNNKGEPVDKL